MQDEQMMTALVSLNNVFIDFENRMVTGMFDTNKMSKKFQPGTVVSRSDCVQLLQQAFPSFHKAQYDYEVIFVNNKFRQAVN